MTINFLEVINTAETIGPWGALRRKYLKENHEGIYTVMLLKGTLWNLLAEINAQAEQLQETLVERMKSAEGVTEELKAQDQKKWFRRMENIRARAREAILNDLIYT